MHTLDIASLLRSNKTIITPPSTNNSAELHLGDCLDVVKTFSDKSIPYVITDPPYGIKYKNCSWDKDLPNPAIWKELHRVTTDNGVLMAFTNKKKLRTLQHHIRLGGWHINFNIFWIIAGRRAQDFENSEFCLWEPTIVASKQKKVREDFSMDYGRPPKKEEKYGDHETPKPIRVMEYLVLMAKKFFPVEKPKALDPFMGSGTTGIACIRHEIDFVGIEMSGKKLEDASAKIRLADYSQKLGELTEDVWLEHAIKVLTIIVDAEDYTFPADIKYHLKGETS